LAKAPSKVYSRRMGLLELQGTITIDQFWPRGNSDADTVKIQVLLTNSERAFHFTPTGARRTRVTRALEGAIVRGKGRRAAIKTDAKSGKAAVTVRLQGVDAPELHYRPSAALKKAAQTSAQHELYLKLNEEYRQFYAERGTVALGRFLAQASHDRPTLKCRVTTEVSSPSDVFDTYGRLVGDVWVELRGRWVNVNTWLTREGHVFPTFYDSMTLSEMESLSTAADEAYVNGAGVWEGVAETVGELDPEMLYRRPVSLRDAELDLSSDAGPVIYPKLFRRLSTWEVNLRAKMFRGSFQQYLAQNPDKVFRTDDFLSNGRQARPYVLADFISSSSNSIDFWPEELVFVEKPSSLFGPDGKEVTAW
jgi:endonuclease YncB( thermonuclease family)